MLTATPLSEVAAEIPKLAAFLSKSLKMSPEQVLTALDENFPRLKQSIDALPRVTNGWNDVPGTADLTRFDGSRVKTTTQVRDYLSKDVIPVLERQEENFNDLADDGGVGYVAPLLFILGIVVIAFAVVVMLLARRREVEKGPATVAWAIVIVVGALVVALVVGFQLFPRLNGGEDLLDDAEPAFTSEHVAGDRAGIEMVSVIVDLADPVATPEGGGAAEVPKLIAFLSEGTGLSQAEVVAALKDTAPHTLGLLQSAPFSEASAEVPKLVAFLSTALKIPEDQVVAALEENFPRLSQSIDALPDVTSGWNDVPGTAGVTRFNGDPVKTVPDARDYLSEDVIPVLERQQQNFQDLDDPWPPLTVFPPLLLAVGLLVAVYGTVMLVGVRRS